MEPNRQHGASLIGVMIGLVVSTIVILGMMFVFRNTIQAVLPSSEAARSDGERISGFLAAHMMLHDAGFGIVDADPAVHLLRIENPDGDPGDEVEFWNRTGTSIIWGKVIDGNARCEGLFADTQGGLRRLATIEPCAVAPDELWKDAEWTETALVSDSRLRDPADEIVDDPDFADRIREIFIDRIEGDCSPFAVGSSEGVRGTVSVRLSYQLNVGGPVVSSTTCLPNF
jgi:hypothetical protein